MQNNYISRYTDKKISASQYLAERICERLAKKDNTDLPAKFWTLPKWKRTFLYQLQIANGLLKLYRADAIIAALRKAPRAFSLAANFLDPIIQTEEAKFIKQENIANNKSHDIPAQDIDTTAKPRPVFNDRQSIVSKLGDL